MKESQTCLLRRASFHDKPAGANAACKQPLSTVSAQTPTPTVADELLNHPRIARELLEAGKFGYAACCSLWTEE